MPDIHAKLSASGSKRWMACPPSANLETQFPDQKSEYASEGTLAHSLAETILRYNQKEISKKAFTTRLNKLKADPQYNQEMEDYIQDYTNMIWEIFHEVKVTCQDAQILFEQRLDFSEYVPDGFGTGDVVIIADDLLQVIDLKYGKGVGVSAENNSQLKLYGIGAYLEHSVLYDIKRLKMTIAQPRLENYSTEEITVKDLLTWAEKEVKPIAALAAEGKGEFQAGDHCRFCKARAICRTRADYELELAKFEFGLPELLKDEEIGEVLKRADALAAWVKDIQNYAFEEAQKGKKFEGWKLVEGRSNRKYTDIGEVKKILTDAGYEEDKINKPAELLGITDMTKLLGKKQFEALLAEKLVKPEGKPVLVPESDNRPELNTAASAQQDFQEKSSTDYNICQKETNEVITEKEII